jgi:aminoglycoside 3-N-acetyltransferase
MPDRRGKSPLLFLCKGGFSKHSLFFSECDIMRLNLNRPSILVSTMNEDQLIQKTHNLPSTVTSLKFDFAALGVKQGMVLLVHSSLRSIGWVCGGPVAVILALEELLGAEGTLVMPAHSGSMTEPSYWKHPPVPESWWPIIRRETPAFDTELTPTRLMGAIAETFRKQSGVSRSSHPSSSFCARGKYASEITSNHSLSFSLGEHSPLARIYDLDGSVLLLGVGYHNNTSLHLAESRASYGSKHLEKQGGPIMVDGARVWQEYQEDSSDDEDFEILGAAFEETRPHDVSVSKVGEAHSRLMRQRALVDYAAEWMTKNRK